MQQTFSPKLLGTLFISALVGCATAPTSENTGTNEALSIARFVTEDSATKTTVIGLDAENHEVARLELVHGTFTLSPSFADEYATPVVDGRKLNVFIGSTRKLTWETAGYEPTLNMPAHPANEWKLIEFLDDPNVKPVLDRWQIGFKPTQVAPSLVGETAYIPQDAVQGQFYGIDIISCAGQTTCGTVQGKTINTCGGGSAPTRAQRGTDDFNNQYKIAQCCPIGDYGPWFGIKTCPLSGTYSECGSSTAACKACPEYPVSDIGYCQVWKYDSSDVSWWYEPAF